MNFQKIQKSCRIHLKWRELQKCCHYCRNCFHSLVLPGVKQAINIPTPGSGTAAGSSSKAFTLHSQEGQDPHGAPEISVAVTQQGQAQQCWPLPCLSLHAHSTIHEAKLGTQKKAGASAQPTYVTPGVGSVCWSRRRSWSNTFLSARCCTRVNQPHEQAAWQHVILRGWARQHPGIFTPPPFTLVAQPWGQMARARPGTRTAQASSLLPHWAGVPPSPSPLVSGSLCSWKPSWERARAQLILHQSEQSPCRWEMEVWTLLRPYWGLLNLRQVP